MHVMKNGAARPGVRLFTSVDEPGFFQRWNPAASVEFSTFVNYPDFRPDKPDEDGHKDLTKFQEALIEAVRKENPEVHILESSIKLDASTGLVAKVARSLPTLPGSLIQGWGGGLRVLCNAPSVNSSVSTLVCLSC